MVLADHRGWLFGGLTLAAVLIVVIHVGEIEELASLLRGMQPGWLLLALAFQAATYPEAARERTPVERRAMLDRTTWPTSLRRAAKLGMQRVDERSNVRQMRFFFAQHEVECLSLEGLHVEVGEGLSARRI